MKGINKSFSRVKVLHNVNLSLKEGEVLGLVGKNGAGKSTLMKILYGVEATDSGDIEIYGKKLDSPKTSSLQSRNIAMIFQELSLIPTLTVAENIFLHNLFKNRFGFLDIKRCRKMANDILNSINIHIDPDEIVENLSIAEKQAVEIVKALSENRNILIMDEPTAAFSFNQVESLFKVIRNLKTRGVSIIYISHNLRHVFEICDRASVLRDGRNILTCVTKDNKFDTVVRGITGIETMEDIDQFHDIRVKKKGIKLKPLLKTKNIRYSNRVNDISFAVYPGEILGIAGLTGSGRTELLESLYGINRLRGGSIYIKGEEIFNISPGKAQNLGIILVPDERQTKGLIMSHSVLYNMILPILHKVKNILFLNYKKSLDIIKQIIKKLNIITPSVHLPVSNLSGGNQQKVVLSKAIASGSQILLLDDPVLGIDIESKQEIATIIKDYIAFGRKAAILVSSEFEILADICDRVLILKNGKVTGELDKNKDYITEENLLALVQ
jgi:ribose transport system ATP-binding protein